MRAVALFVSLSLFLPALSQGRETPGVPIGTGTTLAKVTMTAPAGGWTAGRMLLVEGSVSDTTIDPVVLSINGDRYLMRTANGSFSRKFPAAYGRNVVTVMATNKAGTSQAQATSYAEIPPVPLKAVLTSDTDGVYTDLHIYEPTNTSQVGPVLDAAHMSHVFWARTSSPTGGTFFLNEQNGSFDQPGYGPYLYIHRAPPRGVFALVGNYWPSGDKAHTLGTLNISLFEGTPREVKRAVTVPLATPGTTRVLAWVNFVDGQQALIYVPGQDRKPPEGGMWPGNLDVATKELEKSASN